MEDEEDLDTLNSLNKIEEKVELNENKKVKKSFISFTEFNKYMLLPFLSSITFGSAFYFFKLFGKKESKELNFLVLF